MKKQLQLAGICCGLAAGFCGAATVQTGQTFVYKPTPAGGLEMVWYLVDWGDGTVTPTWHGLANFSPEMSKVWNRPGTFKIQPQATTASGRRIPLTGSPITVSGSVVKESVPLPAKSSEAPQATDESRQPQSYTIHFDRIETVDRLELAKQTGTTFPDNFCVEVSTDGGKVWNDIPAAVYSHFPDPGDKKVCIPLHGLSASDLRVTSYKPLQNASGKYELRMKDPVAFGGEKLFCMDADPMAEADWNNMWLTYGSAANEVLHNFDPWWPTTRPDEGGLLGIGSTIWSHWNAMKGSWLNDPASKKYYEGCVNSYPQDDRGLMGVAPGTFYHLDHMTNRLAELDALIIVTKHKLANSETDNAYLTAELQKQLAQKAELQRKFNDLNVVRAQVKKLRDELFVARRLEWMANGADPSTPTKGAALLMRRTPAPAATVSVSPASPASASAKAAASATSPAKPASPFDLNVEVGSDGSVHVIPPATNTTAH